MTAKRKLILYIAMSLDGYIAKPNDDLSFLSIVEQEGQDYGYNDFVKSIDTIIIGRKTFDKVISMGFEYPHTDKEVYIISRTPRPDYGTFKYYTKNLKDLVLKLKSEQGKNIFCDGGAEIVHELLMDNLIDEFVISVIPIILGDGVPLFKKGRPELNLRLIDSRQFDKGLVQLHYIRT
ncbi:MAG: dihydrofolate reductase family protein [Bacteroidota bacterium]|nr:dihydrofolate reductase family protein [Bacteroidota bacterium]